MGDDSYSGDFSFGDSNGGNGENDTSNTFELNQAFDFTGDIRPVVSFATKWSIEKDDNAKFQISTDGGTTWIALEEYSRNNDWKVELFDLEAYSSFTDVRFRFTMDTDGFIPGDGFYFDDFTVTAFDIETLNSAVFDTERVAVYPNPFDSDGFNVKAPTEIISDITEIQLSDVLGRTIVVNFTKESNSITVKETASLSPGIYFVSILDTKGSVLAVKKLVKI